MPHPMRDLAAPARRARHLLPTEVSDTVDHPVTLKPPVLVNTGTTVATFAVLAAESPDADIVKWDVAAFGLAA